MSIRIEPFSEPDGRTTWAAREYVECEGYFRRQIVKWFETREEGEQWLEALRGGEQP